jgi:hypothetical protein
MQSPSSKVFPPSFFHGVSHVPFEKETIENEEDGMVVGKGDDTRPFSISEECQLKAFAPVLHAKFFNDKKGEFSLTPKTMDMHFSVQGEEGLYVTLKALFLLEDMEGSSSAAVSIGKLPGFVLLKESHTLDCVYKMDVVVKEKTEAQSRFDEAKNREDACASLSKTGDDSFIFQFSSLCESLEVEVLLFSAGPKFRPLMTQSGEEQLSKFADFCVAIPSSPLDSAITKIGVSVSLSDDCSPILPSDDAAIYMDQNVFVGSKARSVWLDPCSFRLSADDKLESKYDVVSPFTCFPTTLFWRVKKIEEFDIVTELSNIGITTVPKSVTCSVPIGNGEVVHKATLSVPSLWKPDVVSSGENEVIVVAVAVDHSGSTSFAGWNGESVCKGLHKYASFALESLPSQVESLVREGFVGKGVSFHLIVVSFDHTSDVLYSGPLTQDAVDDVKGKLSSIVPGGGTNFDTFRKAFKQYVLDVLSSSDQEKIVHLVCLLFSDGGDFGIGTEVADLKEKVEKTGGKYQMVCVGSGMWLSEPTMIENTTYPFSALLVRNLDDAGKRSVLVVLPRMISICKPSLCCKVTGGKVLSVSEEGGTDTGLRATFGQGDIFDNSSLSQTTFFVDLGSLYTIVYSTFGEEDVKIGVGGCDVQVYDKKEDSLKVAVACLQELDPLFSSKKKVERGSSLFVNQTILKVGVAFQIVTSLTSSSSVLKREVYLTPPSKQAEAEVSLIQYMSASSVPTTFSSIFRGLGDAGDEAPVYRSLGASFSYSEPKKVAFSHSPSVSEWISASNSKFPLYASKGKDNYLSCLGALIAEIEDIVANCVENEKQAFKRVKLFSSVDTLVLSSFVPSSSFDKTDLLLAVLESAFLVHPPSPHHKGSTLDLLKEGVKSAKERLSAM